MVTQLPKLASIVPYPLLPQLTGERIAMTDARDVPIAPYMVSHPDGDGRGTRPALLAKLSMGQHNVVEVDQQPDPSRVPYQRSMKAVDGCS
jgi:hypothetical protein